MLLRYLIIFWSFGVYALEPSLPSEREQAQQVAQATKMLEFAKNSLIKNTDVAKNEFNIPDSKNNNNFNNGVTKDVKYNTAEYRDIFYSSEDSALINQAVDYFKQGRVMVVKQKEFTTKKTDVTREPILKLSSIIYNNESQWTVFTSFGKMTYNKPYINDIKITGISENEVEILIPMTDSMRDSIQKMKMDIKSRENVWVHNNNIVVKMRTGECIFEHDLKITSRCVPIIEQVEKQVEI